MSPPPPLDAQALVDGLAGMEPDVFSKMSTDDRNAISAYLSHHRAPTIAAVLELPSAESLTFVLSAQGWPWPLARGHGGPHYAWPTVLQSCDVHTAVAGLAQGHPR